MAIVKKVYETVRVPVDAGVEVAVDDLLYMDSSGYAVPLSALVGSSGSGLEILEVAHGSFLGTALDKTTGNETTDTEILVATKIDATYPLESAASATADVGDYVGGENLATGYIDPQKLAVLDPVTGVAVTVDGAIGYLIQKVAVGDTQVTARLLSAVCGGGVQSVI